MSGTFRACSAPVAKTQKRRCQGPSMRVQGTPHMGGVRQAEVPYCMPATHIALFKVGKPRAPDARAGRSARGCRRRPCRRRSTRCAGGACRRRRPWRRWPAARRRPRPRGCARRGRCWRLHAWRRRRCRRLERVVDVAILHDEEDDACRGRGGGKEVTKVNCTKKIGAGGGAA